MSALVAGKSAPAVKLPLLGGGAFDLQQALARGPVLLAFFKVSCPICQFAFPYYERIHQATKGKNVSVIGVSQNNAKDTAAFNREFGITFPTALDDTEKFPVSNAYGLTNVPTLFLIDPDGSIAVSSAGWSRAEVDDVARRLAAASQAKFAIFKAGENVPEWKAG